MAEKATTQGRKYERTPEQKEAEAKARERRALKREAKKGTEETTKVEKGKPKIEVTAPTEMTPREAVDLLYDFPDNAPASAAEPEATPKTKPKSPYASEKDEARSSREATVALADPAKVAEGREMLGAFYSVEETAAILGVTTRTIQQKLRDGALEGIKIGGGWRISAGALKRFMKI